MTPIVALYEDRYGGPADADTAVRYHEKLDFPAFPVMADEGYQTWDHTPYDGTGMPALCVLSPDMVMVECTTGHNEIEELLIRAVAGG